jgi:replication-associated recombination protein RarA
MSNIQTTTNIVKWVAAHKTEVNIPLMLWGQHGVGKTSIIHQVAKDMGYNCVVLNLANQTPEDLLGQCNGKGGYHTPEWILKDSKTPTIYFLDEFNRGQKYVVQCMFNFINEGRLHTHTINANDIVIAACNPDNANYTVVSFDDDAMTSRFCHIKVMPSKNEFCSYLDSKVKNSIIQKMLAQSVSAYTAENAFDLHFKCAPDNRNFEKIARMLDIMVKDEVQSIGTTIIEGMVGFETMAMIMEVYKKEGERFDVSKILTSTKYPFKAEDIEQLNAVNIEFIAFLKTHIKAEKTLTEKEKKNIMAYIKFLPRDIAVKVLRGVQQALEEGGMKLRDLLNTKEDKEFIVKIMEI